MKKVLYIMHYYKPKETSVLYRCFLYVLFSVFFIANSAATVRYVSKAGTADGIGTSWGTASNDLQAMINASGYGDEIWVAKGTYLPIRRANNVTGTTTSGDRNNAFVLKADVKIYGGFAGDETVLAARDLLANTTILSGDFNGNDAVSGSGNTLSIINNGENAYHVVIAVGEVGTAVLDGFTIKGGNANGTANILVNSRPLYQGHGAGFYNYTSSPTVTNCSFTGNNVSGGGSGGGMFNESSSPAITNCSFTNNRANYGAGMYNSESSPTITNCSFAGNNTFTSFSGGGGMYNYSSSKPCSPVITNCSFTGNSASGGGSGGGMFNSAYNTSPIITNCSFVGNNASSGGGLHNAGISKPQLRNSIVWGNTATSGAGISNVSSSITTVSYSIVQDGAAGTGNLNENPLFTDAASGNLRLQCGSPAINAGDNNLIPSGIITDLDGNARIQSTTVDMGAYEGAPISVSTALATATSSHTQIHVDNISYGSCGNLIASLQSNGTNPIAGSVTVKVWTDATQNSQYVKRHYEITPATNATTATGRATIYFTQQEFTDFNAINTVKLPTSASDAAGKANLMIEKRGGTSSDGTGLPATYSGDITTINPDDANIIWNATASRWEVSFDVTGFSGFFVTSQLTVLPVSFGAISASIQNNKLTINWQTLTEIDNDHFEIEASQDGVNFTTIATVTSKAQNGNSSATLQYSWEADSGALAAFSGLGIILLILLLPVANRYKKQLSMVSVALFIAFISCSKRTDNLAENPGDNYFIRIAQVDKDGGKTYSKIVRVVY